MTSRILAAVGAAMLLVSLGCQTQLPKVWSFSEVRSHAERLDTEVGWLHSDIKEVVFGIDDYRPMVFWNHYEQ